MCASYGELMNPFILTRGQPLLDLLLARHLNVILLLFATDFDVLNSSNPIHHELHEQLTMVHMVFLMKTLCAKFSPFSCD